ncbi:MAG: carbohydrate ABC transporter permease [Oscillospiraceae bacterium]|nr:carbohydrate ABC transporter permease [Oscillospiraceae bacterium]
MERVDMVRSTGERDFFEKKPGKKLQNGKRKWVDLCASIVLIAFALFIVSPVLIVAVRAFSEGTKPFVDFYVWKPTYLRGLSNSLVISLSASLGTVVVSVLAAYVFAKVKFKGRSVIFYLYIIVMMMPFQVTLLPQYIVSRRFALYDMPWAMILPGFFAPFAAFLLTQVMKSVPDELIEAARLDTGSTLKIIWHIIVPTIRPGIICAWVLSFTEQWNAIAEPIILMETREKYPLAILLNEIRPGDVLGFAATLMFFLAPLLLFSFFEDEVMEGLGDYGLK